MHDERGLDRHGRAVAGIDPLDLARDQAVADIIEPGAAIFDRNGRSEQAERAHLGHDLPVERLVEIGLGHPRLKPVLGVASGGVADQPLLVAQLPVEPEGVLPVELRDPGFGHLHSFRGGEGGIRTHGGREPTAVFKTAALNHSATSPASTCL